MNDEYVSIFNAATTLCSMKYTTNNPFNTPINIPLYTGTKTPNFCARCNTVNTPCWRKGVTIMTPNGTILYENVCNACGLKKQTQKHEASFNDIVILQQQPCVYRPNRQEGLIKSL